MKNATPSKEERTTSLAKRQASKLPYRGRCFEELLRYTLVKREEAARKRSAGRKTVNYSPSQNTDYTKRALLSRSTQVTASIQGAGRPYYTPGIHSTIPAPAS